MHEEGSGKKYFGSEENIYDSRVPDLIQQKVLLYTVIVSEIDFK